MIQLQGKFRSLGAEFQQYVASTRSPFLELPAEIRNRIYGFVFKKKIYKITSNVFPEHPLLAVAKQIRKEAGPIFYRRPVFEPNPVNYDSTPFFTCAFKKRAVLKEFKIDFDGSECLTCQNPNWENLLIRLRRVHTYHETVDVFARDGFHIVDAGETSELNIINAMHHVVLDMGQYRVERNRRWLHTPSVSRSIELR